MSAAVIDDETLGRLARLARGLSAEPGLTVATGDNPHFDPARSRIAIDVDSAMDSDRVRGILAHECGHVNLSRYFLWPAPVDRPAVWFTLLNALEDPRVETWMARRYPGGAPWFAALQRTAERTAGVRPSLFVQFVLALASRGNDDAPPASPSCDPEVVDALARVWPARRRYIDAVPRPGHRDAPPAGAASGMSTTDGDTGPLGVVERDVRAWARVAWRIARDEILPEALALCDLDAEHVGRFAAGDRKADAALRSSDWARLAQAAQAAFTSGRSLPAGAPTDDEKRDEHARVAFDAYIGELRRTRADVPVPGPGGGTEAPPDDTGPDGTGGVPQQLIAKVEPQVMKQVDALSSTLDRIVLALRRKRWYGGFRSGRAIDLKLAMAFEADPREDRIWRRRAEAPSHLGSIGMLVDLSGSMASDGKIEAAIAGTLLLCAAATRAGIDFVVDGFQDRLIPIAAFGQGLTPAVRARIGGMALEVAGSRPGGNNRPRYNDDGPCLQEFAAKLEPRPGARHLLLVISDGRPEGSRSTANDLRRTVQDLTARRDLRLIGLGLGESTGHVRDFYPAAIVDVPVGRLATEIGAILLRHCRLI